MYEFNHSVYVKFSPIENVQNMYAAIGAFTLDSYFRLWLFSLWINPHCCMDRELIMLGRNISKGTTVTI